MWRLKENEKDQQEDDIRTAVAGFTLLAAKIYTYKGAFLGKANTE
jgi:hypothetical protein